VSRKGLDRLQPVLARCARAQRALDPAAQLAAPHRGRGAVEHVEQRAVRPSRQARVELEVTARGRIELQRLVALLAANAAQVGQGGLLRLAQVVEQAAGGADRERLVGEAEAREVAGAELLAEQPLGAPGLEVPRRTLAHGAGGATGEGGRVLGDEQFRGPQALELRRERLESSGLERVEASARELEPGEPEAVTRTGERREQRVAARLEQRVVGDRAGRHHRTTCRSTGPLDFAGSPICSQIATDSPLRTARAR